MEHIEYKTVPIEKLKPDPNQPRKTIDEEEIEEIAVSIKNEGVINPIEIDKDFLIITGERRWRAAKIAGLKEVPTKILKVTADERFIRQVQENIHQNTMAPLDTAEALEKIRKMLTSSTVELVRDPKHQGERSKKGIKELHELLGKPQGTILRYLNLLGETEEMKKALRTPGFQVTKIEVLKDVPKKYRTGLRSLIAKQKNIPRDTITHLAKALRRAERYGEDYNAKKVLGQNYEGLSSVDALNRINRIIPDEESRVKEPADAVRLISEKIIELMGLLERHPLQTFGTLHRPLVIKDLQNLGFFLTTYFKGVSDAKLLNKENKK